MEYTQHAANSVKLTTQDKQKIISHVDGTNTEKFGEK